jgi:very-short-patch-repair endonuclease
MKYTSSDLIAICSRVAADMLPALETALAPDSYYLGDLVESPIELQLGLAIEAYCQINYGSDYVAFAPHIERAQAIADNFTGAIIVPQFKFHGYRFDFCAFCSSGKSFFIECDGHEFHERTKQQAARDRSKDRAAQLVGHAILRFTGSEIYNKPRICAEEVVQLIERF